MSDIEEVLKIDKSLRPNYYRRTEDIARIIDPGAFADGVVTPPDAARLHLLRQRVLQGNAMRKAHDILEYLGVHSEANWFAILTQLAERAKGGEG